MAIECALERWSAEEEAPKEWSSKQKGIGGTEVKSLCESQRLDRKEWTWAWSNAFLEQAKQVLKWRKDVQKGKWGAFVSTELKENMMPPRKE